MAEGAPPRAVVVGAGPSGFYAAAALLDAGFAVDLLDRLPTPFGLVRAGVAPDHPKIKAVTRVYEKIARRAGMRFFGGVAVGGAVGVDELAARWDAVVWAVGAPLPVALGIAGEGLDGCHPASDVVGWYNGHPDHAARSFGLDVERAVVLGNGNVALDVARMLLRDPAELALTDIADHALDALAGARVREVVVVGRRGPLQAAFTDGELVELGRIAGLEVAFDDSLTLDPLSAAALAAEPEGSPARRKLEALGALAASAVAGTPPPADAAASPADAAPPPADAAASPADAAAPPADPARLTFRFLRSPLELLGHDGRVSGIRLAVNRLAERDGRLVAEPTGAEETLACGLVVSAVGHQAAPLPGLPLAGGTIANDDGRVRGRAREYVVGWAKRGPSGVIGTNKGDAQETVARIVADREAGLLAASASAGPARDASPAPDAPAARDAEAWLRERVPELVEWVGWEAIDAHERALGAPAGRPRAKLVDLAAMSAVAAPPSG